MVYSFDYIVPQGPLLILTLTLVEPTLSSKWWDNIFDHDLEWHQSMEVVDLCWPSSMGSYENKQSFISQISIGSSSLNSQ